jgi:hypothetical protein
MGLVAKILQFTRKIKNGAKVTDVTVNDYGSANITAAHFSSAGDDSYPLNTDYAFLVDSAQNGRKVALGYIDPINDPVTNYGEKRIYGRTTGGEVSAEVLLKNNGQIDIKNDLISAVFNQDGSLTVNNGSGSLIMLSNGDVNINGVVISSSGDVSMPNSLVLDGKEINGHDHNILYGSSSPGPTGGNN